jgi:CRP-like cAMP-binding protein
MLYKLLFHGMSEAEVAEIGRYFKEELIRRGSPVAVEGDLADTLYVIAEGTAEVRVGRQPIFELGPGGVFGEVGLLGQALRTMGLFAASDMRVHGLSSGSYEALFARQPRVALKLTQNLLRVADHRLAAVARMSRVEERTEPEPTSKPARGWPRFLKPSVRSERVDDRPNDRPAPAPPPDPKLHETRQLADLLHRSGFVPPDQDLRTWRRSGASGRR